MSKLSDYLERAKQFPAEADAIKAMHDAYKRLEDLGWKSIIHAPEDGSIIKLLDPEAMRIQEGYYDTDWCEWFVYNEKINDVVISIPILFK